MYGGRCTMAWINGLNTFLDAAEAHRSSKGFMCCPCRICRNNKEFSRRKTLQAHLYESGFMDNYTIWTKHGEPGVLMEDDEDNDDDNTIPDLAHLYEAGAFNDEPMDEVEENAAEDVPHDNLRQVLLDAQKDSDTVKESMKFEKMLEDHKKLLYPDCKQGHKKLGTTLELLQWKAANGVTDKGFEELLVIVKNMLPEGNVLPSSTYEAKKVVCPLGLDVQKIHACPNDCILYRGEYENLDACPVCDAKRYKLRRNDTGDAGKKIPAKVMWYFPIIPRLKRLFRNKSHAKLVRWHKEERKQDQMLRHPADGSQWRNLNREFPEFDKDARNIRFGMSTDGINPFGEWGSSHSTWPVTLCMYNLPSWLCMKRKYIIMPVLIQGPKQPGNDIDVYLRPLMDDLLLLWKEEGVRVWDEYEQETFNLRALLFVTINDWPALSNLSGQSNKGYQACTHCLDETDSFYLKHCRKVVYMGHRRFLPLNHPLRGKCKHFKGEPETRAKPMFRDGKTVFSMMKDVRVVFGKGRGSQQVPNDENGHTPMWKKKSILWELPYWKSLEVRNAIDVMHLTKNLCVNVLGFLGTYGQGKDTLEARRDLKDLKQREDLSPEKRDNGQHYLRPASYTLSKEEKQSMFDCLNSIKVPSGYSSNIQGRINMKEKKFTNLKSHDCHVLMTQLFPVALRGILPENVRLAIVKLCAFLNEISQKAIDPNKLINLQNDVVQCLVSFEMVFPPSFFNIMTHLLVHIVKEITILGPVFLHNMFPFERYMAVLKKYVHNRSRPEGCIAKGYGTEEVIEFCVDFIDEISPIGVPKSRHEGRLKGKGTLGKKANVNIPDKDIRKANFTVLQNSSLVAPYIEEHMNIVRSENLGKSETWITRHHIDTFATWLRRKFMGDGTINEQLQWLARGPSVTIMQYQGYEINGYTFYTRAQDEKSTNQNSGVRIDAIGNDGNKDSYFGVIEEIWELDYGPHLKIPLFRCEWVNRAGRGVTTDRYGMTIVDFKKIGYKDEPFVLAKDVTQVFYVKDMSSKSKNNEPKRHIVLPGKRKIIGVEDISDKSEDFDQFDDLPPFAVNVDPSILLSKEDAPYLRRDHNQGTFVKRKITNIPLRNDE
jgi:Transposase family tnp2/Domain of unknown function (DUF4218)/Transposase-associated domain/Domain of unknown function (DUF4216)